MGRRQATRHVLTIGACAAWIAGASLWAWPFTVDDAFIVAGYARQIHEHASYSLDGSHRSDGVTGPLWLVPFLLAHVLHLAPLGVAKAVGLVSTLVAVVLVLWRLGLRCGSRALVPAAALVCAGQSDLAIWAIGGLETGVATLLMTLSALVVSKPRWTGSDGVMLGVLIASLAWLRPEAAVFSAVLLIAACARARRHGMLAIALAMVGILSVFTFRSVMFGHLWPLSALAKPAELGHGVHYVLSALPLITGVIGVPLFVHGMIAGHASDRWVGAAAMAHVVAVTLAGGDWMPGFRLLVPVLPLYAWLVAVGVVRLRRRRWGIALLIACALLPFASLVVQVPEARASARDRSRGGVELAQWLKGHACRVALVDVGYLVYASGVQSVDLAGITDGSIARLPGGHVNKRVTAAQLIDRAPDTLILRGKRNRPIDQGLPRDAEWQSGTEHRLAQDAAIRSRYRPVKVVRYAQDYVYYVLQDVDSRAQRCSSR